MGPSALFMIYLEPEGHREHSRLSMLDEKNFGHGVQSLIDELPVNTLIVPEGHSVASMLPVQ